MLDQIRFFAGAARVLEVNRPASTWPITPRGSRREPVGVIGQVAPWNYPMMMAIWKFCPAIAAGNTVVLKPSDTTPVSSVMLAEIAAKHFPAGVLNVVCGDRATGAAVVAHPTPQIGLDHRFGRSRSRGGRRCGRQSQRTHLGWAAEAPVIVFDDRDVGAAAEAIAVAGYFNAGQDCTAATRVMAQAGVAQDLADALAEQAKGAFTTFGRAADDEDGWIPPVNNPNQLERILSFLADIPKHAVLAAAKPSRATRVLHRADGHQRTAPGRPAHPGRNLRPGDHRASPSPTRTRRSASPTVSSTAWPRRCGPRTSSAHFGFRRRWTSAACGSTPTSRWSPRCRTAVTSPPDTARTCRCTALRTTPASSM